MEKILILDIETTGFLNQGGSIVEIGIVDLDLDTGEINEVFNSCLREDILSAKHREEPFGWIFKNSDLTIEEVREAPIAFEVLAVVQGILNTYSLGCTAYNNTFDFGFLEDRGLKIKKLPCPMKLAAPVCKIPKKRRSKSPTIKGFKSPNVEEAFHFFYPEINYVEKHRGLDDAKHEAMIVYKLYQMGVFKLPELQKELF